MGSAVVGIIANPFSGKDIRRLVAYGSTMDNLGKVRTLQRVLAGLREAGVRQVLYMPDPAALVPSAFDAMRPDDREGMEIIPVLEVIRGKSEESALATAAMVRQGVGAIITLGGDGTNRLVAAEAGEVPILPIAAGTNNAFSTWIEPTIAGLAAGLVAMGSTAGCRREKWMWVTVRTRSEVALVDVAFLRGDHTGAGAIWEPELLQELVVTQGLPHAIGLSAIAGQVCPLRREEPAGVYIRFGPGRAIRAPITPGRFETLSVAASSRISAGSTIQLGPGPGVLALDGERLLTVPAGVRPAVSLEPEGPVVIDPAAVLAQR